MPKDIEEEFEEEKEDSDIYGEEGRDELEESDEITPEEEGFMEGYDEGEKAANCSMCGKVLLDDFVEREIDNEICRFCSNSCADQYMEKIEKGKKKQ